ncbi:hypothetical protein AOA60_01295 [Pseudomonas sp. 2822-17]|nr:hypothetical protein AOA60_01295 [Pseudomonas sp. 2822-17]
MKAPLHTRQGEVLARGEGVAGDCESEGSPRQIAGLTNWNRIEAAQRGKKAITLTVLSELFNFGEYLHHDL